MTTVILHPVFSASEWRDETPRAKEATLRSGTLITICGLTVLLERAGSQSQEAADVVLQPDPKVFKRLQEMKDATELRVADIKRASSLDLVDRRAQWRANQRRHQRG